ncbi:hypothetical protein Tco_0883950, partial [Tanacetum coccineum]
MSMRPLMKSRISEEFNGGALTFFLDYKSNRRKDGIFISQDKYVCRNPEKFDFANVKTASPPIETQKPFSNDEEARKSITGGLSIYSRRLFLRHAKVDHCGYFYYRGIICCCCKLLWNPVYHSKIKHIAIRHYFIRDAYEKKLIQVLKIHTDDNVADLLTKAFDVSRFQFLVVTIRM